MTIRWSPLSVAIAICIVQQKLGWLFSDVIYYSVSSDQGLAAGRYRAGVSTRSDLDVRPSLLKPRIRRDGVHLHRIEQSPGAVYLCVPLRTEREGKGIRRGTEVRLDLDHSGNIAGCSRREKEKDTNNKVRSCL